MSSFAARIETALSFLTIALFNKSKKHRCLIEETLAPTPQPPSPKPLQAEKKPQAAPAAIPPPVQKQEATPLRMIQSYIPYLHILSEQPKKAQEHLLDTFSLFLEKCGQSSGINHIPPTTMPWQQSVPHIAIVTACIQGSPKELFLQKVGAALEERLGKKVVRIQTSQESGAIVTALASTNLMQAVLLAYDKTSQKEAASWLGMLPVHAAEVQNGMLESSFALFSVPIYELEIPHDGENDASFKALLWKALQSL